MCPLLGASSDRQRHVPNGGLPTRSLAQSIADEGRAVLITMGTLDQVRGNAAVYSGQYARANDRAA